MNFTCIKVKLGTQEHLEELRLEGLVYCNTLKYFTKIEDGLVRGDKHEDAFEFKTFNDPELLIKPANEPDTSFKKVNITWAQIVKRNSEVFGNLFCLHCVDMTHAKDEGQIFVDEQNREFGTHALILLDPDKFEKKIFNELEKIKLKYHCGHLNYLDLKNYNGKKNLFQKDNKYSYQNEFRIFIENNIQEPLVLKIGDISDISMLIDFETLKEVRYKRL